MADRPLVVALSGSLRGASKTRVAARRALDAAEAAGAETTLLDLREFDLPAFDADARDAGDAPALRRRVAAADGVLLATPNYHGSFAAPLKNALDYCGRDEFAGTTVGLLEVAGGSFPGSALMHLRTVARTLSAWTLPLEVAVPNASEAVVDGEVRDPDVGSRIDDLGRQLVAYAGVERYPEVAEPARPPAPTD